ncbi:hypothetical protein PUN28_005323 [Cardiocondyla obscurior]|uniref:Uncharacterized protein n=1 Tax=Cardiocondyla obscurior TaxID=286306 RepID=A0AAW2GI48_9HYME
MLGLTFSPGQPAATRRAHVGKTQRWSNLKENHQLISFSRQRLFNCFNFRAPGGRVGSRSRFIETLNLIRGKKSICLHSRGASVFAATSGRQFSSRALINPKRTSFLSFSFLTTRNVHLFRVAGELRKLCRTLARTRSWPVARRSFLNRLKRLNFRNT